MSKPTTPADKYLKQIVGDNPYLLKALRQLFEQAGTLSPEAIEEALIAAGNAAASATEANDAINRLANAVELLALKPEKEDIEISDDLSPASNNGTIASQNADNVDITGGDITGLDNLEADGAIFGDPGFESDGINIGGTIFNSTTKVSDIGGTNPAQTILHRHSTTLPPAIIGARSHSNTSTHAIVVNGDNLLDIFAVGWDGNNYKIAVSVRMEVDGVPGSNDMPGRYIISTTPSGAFIPVDALEVDSDQKVKLLVNPLELTEGGTGSRTVTSTNIGHLESTDQDLGTGDSISYVDGAFSGKASFGDRTTKTISGGSITVTSSYHRVDTQGAASTDDLTAIAGGVSGMRLVLQAVSSARTVVVKDGTNIRLAGDFSLDNLNDTIELISDGTNWRELTRSDNGA